MESFSRTVQKITPHKKPVAHFNTEGDFIVAGVKLSVREKVGYSLGDAASHIVFDSSVAILAWYYTDIYGLPPAVMGTMF